VRHVFVRAELDTDRHEREPFAFNRVSEGGIGRKSHDVAAPGQFPSDRKKGKQITRRP
jgi:hypothetical protein